MAYSWELAYCAGVLDSDGCVGLYKRSDRGYRVLVTVAQTSDAAVTVLHELFGGHLYLKKNGRNRNWKPLYWWGISAKQAEECLRKLVPYLKVKRKQAELCIRYYGVPRPTKRQMANLCRQSRELNRIGR